MIKKTITLALTFAIVISCFVPSAFADDTTSVGEVVDDIVSGTIASALLSEAFTAIGTGVGFYFGFPAVGTFVGGIVGEGIQNLADYYAAGYTDQDILDEYNNYVTDLETDLGTTTLIDGGVRSIFAPTGYGMFSRVSSDETSILLGGSGASGTIVTNDLYSATSASHTRSATWEIWFDTAITAPYSGTYTIGISDNHSFSPADVLYTPPSGDGPYDVSQGASIRPFSYTYSGNQYHSRAKFRVDASSIVVDNFSFSCWVNFFPATGSLPTSLDITPISRPTSLVVPVGVRNEDNSYTVYNQTIVNETDSTIFNPVTNITTVFTDWAFDYSTRTYTLTLEDGSIVTVIYGDDCMTIIQGDQEYTVYYVIPSEEDPGADPDDPGTDDGSGWAWLKGAWTEMMDKLTGILEAITDLELSPEINVEVEVGGEEQVTQESWFSELLTKFAFITSVHDIYTQLVADVTSDAATAAAVADGEVMLADVTNGHASVYAAERHGFYTAPELAISFGSSDKYGVDWANIRALDLSWYAPHKETVDGILSGILWLSYLFLLIKRLPGIIRGGEMVTEGGIEIQNWRMRH